MSKEKGSVLSATLIIIGLILVALLIFGILYSARDGAANLGLNEGNRGGVTRENEGASTLQRIAEGDTALLGRTVSVSGEVEDVKGNRTFTLQEDEIDTDEVLVLTRRPLSTEQAAQAEQFFGDNARVRVQGRVVRVGVAEIERELGLDLDPEFETEFRNRAAIIANSITFLDRDNAAFDFYEPQATPAP